MGEPIRIGMGEFRVAHNPGVLTCVGLGSCVGLILYDAVTKTGGMAHIMLPRRGEIRRSSGPGKFADSAVEVLLNTMERHGASKRRLLAKLFGGANMFPAVQSDVLVHVGQRNLEAVREELTARRIPIVAEEVGGEIGRTILFETSNGRVRVRGAMGDERVY